VRPDRSLVLPILTDTRTAAILPNRIEQSTNGASEMVPLYTARVQDLGPEDVAVFKCGACGHTAELPPSALIRGLGLQPTDKVLDLERRLACRV